MAVACVLRWRSFLRVVRSFGKKRKENVLPLALFRNAAGCTGSVRRAHQLKCGLRLEHCAPNSCLLRYLGCDADGRLLLFLGYLFYLYSLGCFLVSQILF